MEFTALSSLEIRDLLNKYHSDLRKLEFQAHRTKTIIDDLNAQIKEIESVLASETAPQTKAAEKPAPAPVAPKAETVAAPAPKEKTAAAPAPKEKAAIPAAKEKAAGPAKKTGARRGRPPGSTKAKLEQKAKAETKAETSTTATAPAKPSAAKKPAAPKKGTEKKRRPGRPPGSKNKKTSEAKTKTTSPKKKPASKAEKIAAEAPGYRASDWDLFVLESITEKQRILTTSQLTDIGIAKPEIKIGAAQIKSKLNRSLHKLANQKGLLVKVKHDGRGFAYGLSEWLNDNGELPKKYAYTD